MPLAEPACPPAAARGPEVSHPASDDGTGRAAGPDLALAARGDGDAFVRLVRLHQARVFSLALRLTGRRDDAEELAQDTFLQLHRNLGRLESGAHLRHWLCRTVTHRAVDLLRRRGRQLPPPTGAGAAADVPAEEAETDLLLHRRLRALLMTLPEVPRAVLVLRYQEDLDPADIAAALDLPVNTVKSHLRRSLEWLRNQRLESP